MKELYYHPSCGRVVFMDAGGEYECGACRDMGQPITSEALNSGYLKMLPVTYVPSLTPVQKRWILDTIYDLAKQAQYGELRSLPDTRADLEKLYSLLKNEFARVGQNT